MWKKYAVLLTPILLAACANQPKTAAATAQDLTIDQQGLSAYQWQLVEAKNVRNQLLSGFPIGTKPTMKLNFRNGYLTLSGGCNGMSASYTFQNNTLQAKQFIGTKMACAEPLMQQDNATSTFLSTTPVKLKLTGNTQTPILLMQDSSGNRLTWQGTPTTESQYGTKPERIFLEVKEKTRACKGAQGQQQCLIVREIRYNAKGIKTRHGSWQNFSDQINGYQHDSAQRQILRINRYTITKPAADQSRYVWELDTVIESETAH